MKPVKALVWLHRHTIWPVFTGHKWEQTLGDHTAKLWRLWYVHAADLNLQLPVSGYKPALFHVSKITWNIWPSRNLEQFAYLSTWSDSSVMTMVTRKYLYSIVNGCRYPDQYAVVHADLSVHIWQKNDSIMKHLQFQIFKLLSESILFPNFLFREHLLLIWVHFLSFSLISVTYW